MKKADFLKAVAHEVKTLRELATEAELDNLNLERLIPLNSENCIYGQMTGSCGSMRAKELMDKACIIVTSGNIDNFEHAKYSKVKMFIGEENRGQGWTNKRLSSNKHWNNRNYGHASALEAYICLKGAKVKNIISYLKGEKIKLIL